MNFLWKCLKTIFLIPIITPNIKDEIKFSHKNYIETNIQIFNKHVKDLFDIESTYIGVTNVIDLTSLTGEKNLNAFKNIYSAIEFPDFIAEIGLFSYTKKIKFFYQNTYNWKENWKSDTIKIIEGSEQIGSAYIYAILSTRIEITKHKILNHLLLKIYFYGTGYFESTASHPWGSINTGWVFRLVN